jgi:hypothetical protein
MCRYANVQMCKCFYNWVNVRIDAQMYKLENVQIIFSHPGSSFAHLHIHAPAHQ